MPVKELLGLLSQLSEEDIQKITEMAKQLTSGSGEKPQTFSKTERKNLFDEMPEKNQFRDPKDKKLYSFPLTPRRPEVHLLELKCRSCGVENSVPPPLVPVEVDRYMCNKCAKSGG